MKKILLLTISILIAMQASAVDFYATVWGAKSDGITDNTGSIQRAVDYISEHGGGTLSIFVGRYVTGSIELKSNVTIYLGEGAVLVAPENIYGYKGAPALFWASALAMCQEHQQQHQQAHKSDLNQRLSKEHK